MRLLWLMGMVRKMENKLKEISERANKVITTVKLLPQITACIESALDVPYLLGVVAELQTKNDQLQDQLAKVMNDPTRGEVFEDLHIADCNNRVLRKALEFIENEAKEGFGKCGKIKYVAHNALIKMKSDPNKTLTHNTQPKPLICRYCNKSFNSIGVDNTYEHNWVNCRSGHGGVNS